MKKISNLISIYLLSLAFACGNKSKIKEIEYDGYTVKGNINFTNHDTIFEGPIEYFDKNGKLSTVINFTNNKRDGEYIDYHSNGKISQTANYSQGELHGIIKLFDSSGKLFYQANYFHGVEMGDRKKISKDTFSSYTFKSFEGLDVYKCGWDSKNKIVENGGLLNYVTNYYMDPDVNKMKLSVFIYLINPPHKKVTYLLFDKNMNTGDSSLIHTTSAKNGCFEKFYIEPQAENHRYLWDVQAYYPTEKITLKNILKEEERPLILPTTQD